jgi:hypothetical protein
MKILTLTLIFASTILAQNDTPRHYFSFFVSAEAYKDGPVEERLAYLSGWLDSRLNAGSFGNAKTIKAMRDCTDGKTITQITAIVDKYVQGHPENWDRPAALEADAAIEEVCPVLRQAVDDH